MLKKVENFHKTMEEIKPIPSSKDTLQARNNMVMSMNTDLRKTYFEFVTNFPEDVTLIDYKIERILHSSNDSNIVVVISKYIKDFLLDRDSCNTSRLELCSKSKKIDLGKGSAMLDVTNIKV